MTLYTFFTLLEERTGNKVSFYPAINLPKEGKMKPPLKHRDHLTIFRSKEVGVYYNLYYYCFACVLF